MVLFIIVGGDRKMKKYYKKLLSLVLALTLTVTGITTFSQPETVAADNTKAAYETTENIDDPIEATVNAEVYFVHKGTGKIITLNGKVDDPIDCNQSISGTNVPAAGLFKVYYNNWEDDTDSITKGKIRKIVNFTNTATNTCWKATETNVFQCDSGQWHPTNPTGWEAVQIEPQDDGTICFKSNANDNYFTVTDGKLALTNLTQDKLTSNEKFVIHTNTVPKAATKVKLSDVSGDCLTVSWSGAEECLFNGYEVLYSITEDGTYASAGKTGKTTFEMKGLKVNTRYYFKVRTFVDENNYKDSKIAYTNTLSSFKPSKISGLKVEEKDGKLVVSWNKANSATAYDIYRADSRFSEYQLLAEGIKGNENGTRIEFTDATPNSKSKFNNYYKVQAVNTESKGEISDEASLEISMFGKNTYVFNETDDPNQIQATTQQIFTQQWHNQFGKERYALAYKPGDYDEAGMLNIGYYTTVHGLGKVPTDTSLFNVNTPAALENKNATCNFWVGIENVQINNTGEDENPEDVNNFFQWGVSQAAPARRLNVKRRTHLQWQWADWGASNQGWCSGGYIADSRFEKQVGSFSQQQYYYRNNDFNEEMIWDNNQQGGVYGVNWNQVIQGCNGVNKETCRDNSSKTFGDGKELINGNGYSNWSQRGCTTVVDSADFIREKPFLYFDSESDRYKVFVPAARHNATGISWSENNMGEGTSIDVEKNFYIANPDVDTADTINHQLELGMNIIFQPGIYYVNKPIQVDEPNTILLGLGMATIIPTNKDSAIKTADVSGLAICGLILDAGNSSETLLTVGTEGCNKIHKNNPSVVQDVFYRVGGTGELGSCKQCEVINSNDVIIDHTWIWRADHGDHVSWYDNTSNNGLVVNGDNVRAYGLFVEHFQEYDILWRGENGATYFLQNEKCYDPQKQSEWMSHNGTKNGYAAYKVANNVKNHYAVGLGVYDVFINTNGASIHLDTAIEVPDTQNVLIENAVISEIANADGPQVGINSIINSTAPGIRTGEGQATAEVKGGYALQRLLSYNNNVSLSLPDYYEVQNQPGGIAGEVLTDDSIVQEAGEAPTNDPDAEKDIKKDALTEDTAYPTKALWNMTDQDYKDKQSYCYDKYLKRLQNKDDEKKQPVKTDDQQDDATWVYNTYGVKVGGIYTIGKYIYKVTSVTRTSGNATVIGVAPKYKATLKTATIPASAKYNGYTLNATAIGSKAFTKLKKLTKVTFGAKIKKIGTSAFASCPKLKTIKFKNVTSIGKKAFYNCKALTKITIGTKVKTIGASAFAKCKKVKKVTIGKNVKTIGKNAFAKCAKITQITFGKKVKTIKAKAFINSKKLKKITFKGKALKKIAKNVFAKNVRKTVKITAKNAKVKKRVLKSLKRTK